MSLRESDKIESGETCSGQYDVLVLAAAGLKRLGLEERIERYFSPEEILPAAGQGILVVQGREEMRELVKELQPEEMEVIAENERAFVRRLDGGCSSPVAAYGRIEQDELVLFLFLNLLQKHLRYHLHRYQM